MHIFAGEEIALHGLAQAQHGDHPILHRAWNVVIQFQLGDGALRGRSLAQCLASVVIEQMAGPHLGAVKGEESQVEVLGVGDAE